VQLQVRTRLQGPGTGSERLYYEGVREPFWPSLYSGSCSLTRRETLKTPPPPPPTLEFRKRVGFRKEGPGKGEKLL